MFTVQWKLFLTLLAAIFFELPITRTFFDFRWRFELSGVDCSPKPIPIIVSFQLSAAFLHQFMSFRNCSLFSLLFIVNLSRSYSFVFFCFQLEPTCTTTKNDYVATNIATTLNVIHANAVVMNYKDLSLKLL